LIIIDSNTLKDNTQQGYLKLANVVQSAGTLVVLIIVASTTLAFGFFTLHSSFFT